MSNSKGLKGAEITALIRLLVLIGLLAIAVLTSEQTRDFLTQVFIEVRYMLLF